MTAYVIWGLPEWKQWEIAGSLIQEVLFRKIALFAEQTADGFHLVGLPPDSSEQCKRIDQELEQKQTPAKHAILARYRRKFPYKGAREELQERLSRYRQDQY